MLPKVAELGLNHALRFRKTFDEKQLFVILKYS